MLTGLASGLASDPAYGGLVFAFLFVVLSLATCYSLFGVAGYLVRAHARHWRPSNDYVPCIEIDEQGRVTINNGAVVYYERRLGSFYL